MHGEQTIGVNADTAKITLTKAQLVQVFEDWEREYRATPNTFFHPSETAAMEVASVSEGRALAFMAYARQRSHIDKADGKEGGAA